MITIILIIILSLFLSAFFSGMEIAYVSSNKLKLELSTKQATTASRILHLFYKNPSQYITTMLIGNNIALVVFGFYASEFIIRTLFPTYSPTNPPFWVMLSQIIISTLVILLVAEFLPKVLFSINPNKVLKGFAFPMVVVYFLFYPITKFTMFLSHFIIRYILRDKSHNAEPNFAFGKVDLNDLIDEDITKDTKADDSVIDSQNIKIFKNVLDFSDIRIKECLIPRTEITAIEVSEEVEEMKRLFIETGHARIIIFKENIDNIIGYVHSSVLFRNPKSIKAVVTHVPIVPESMPAQKVLRRLNEENKGIAVVVDEFGGTEGIVTLEDIMEEIFGEIEDEHDKKDLTEQKINDKEYIFSGRQEIDYLNDKYQLYLPNEDEYETIAGLILHTKEDIPKLNEEVIIGKYFRFKILEVSNTRIEKVQLFIDN